MAYGGAPFEFGAQNQQWPSVFGEYMNTNQASSSRNSPSLFLSGSSDSINSLSSMFNGVLQLANGDFNGLGYNRECVCTDHVVCENCMIRYTYQQRLNNNYSPDYFASPSTSTGTPSPLLQMVQPSGMGIIICDRHPDSTSYFCQTCSIPLCGECGLRLHHGHATVYLSVAIDNIGMQTRQVLGETLYEIKNFTEDLEAVASAAESLELKSKQATEDATTSVRRLILDLEGRLRTLMHDIHQAKILKMDSLRARDETLRNNIIALKQTAEGLKKAMETSITSMNLMELTLLKDQAIAQIHLIHQTRKSLPQLEEQWISFNGTDSTIQNSIQQFGTITLNNPGLIGDRRAVRGRGNASRRSAPVRSHTLVPVPRGRPVPGNHFPVIVWPRQYNRTFRRTFIKVFGNEGPLADRLCRPWGVACDKEGYVIVADRSNNRIQIYLENGVFIRRFGSQGTGPGQFDRPAGVAVDIRRRIIVADKDNHRIQILTMEGVFLLAFGERGTGDGQFNYPWDVAVNSSCQILVSDTRNHRIQLFSPEGVFLKKYGAEHSGVPLKVLDSPRGVAFTPEGNIIVTDFNNHRMVAVDADCTKSRNMGEKDDNKLFCRPQGIAIDDQGNIVVADSRNHRIQVFDSTGMLLYKFGSYGIGYGEMDRPSGIALTPSGRIVVVDFGNNRIVIV